MSRAAERRLWGPHARPGPQLRRAGGLVSERGWTLSGACGRRRHGGRAEWRRGPRQRGHRGAPCRVILRPSASRPFRVADEHGRGLGWQRRAEPPALRGHAPRGHTPRASRPLVFCCPQRPTVLPAAAAAAVGRRPSTVFSPRSAPPGRTPAAPPRGVGPPAGLLRFSFMTLFSFQTFLVGAPRPSFMGRMREETQTHKSIRFVQSPLFKQFHPKPCESETLTPSHGPLGSVCP